MIKRVDLDKMIEQVTNSENTRLICDNCSEHLSKHRLVATDLVCPNQPGHFRSIWLAADVGSFPPFI